MKVEQDSDRRIIYQAGDVVGVANYKVLGKAAFHIFEPQTPLFHFLLIDGYLEDEDDYSIIESVAKGPTMGRLSWYAKRDYQVFRVNEGHVKFWTVFRNHALRLNASRSSEYLGEVAVEKASCFGRHGYDFTLYLKLALAVLQFQVNRLVHGQRPCRMKPEDVPYSRDKAFVCTELVFEAWRAVGIELRALDHAPLPCEFVLAEDRGELNRIDFHNGTKGQAWRSRQNAIPTPVVEPTRPTTVVNIPRDKMEAGKPNRDIIARQGGQKRNRVHVYRQPFGYPIRLCDWNAEAIEDLEVLGTWDEANTLAETPLDKALSYHADAIGKRYCRNCEAVVQGKRSSFGQDNRGHGKGAPLC